VFYSELRTDLVICQSDNPFGLTAKSDLFFQVIHHHRHRLNTFLVVSASQPSCIKHCILWCM